MAEAYTVHRVQVLPEPWVEAGHDYADAFEVRLAQPDQHPAGEWLRTAVDESAPRVLAIIRFVHSRIARFSLSAEPNSILGWDTVSSASDACHIETRGPLLSADIVLRRTSDTTATVTTFLFYARRSARLLWFVIGPLHRRIAPYLIARAASQLTARTRPQPT